MALSQRLFPFYPYKTEDTLRPEGSSFEKFVNGLLLTLQRSSNVLLICWKKVFQGGGSLLAKCN